MTKEFDEMLGRTLETALGIPEDERGGAMQSGVVQGQPTSALDAVERLFKRPVKLGGEPATSGPVEEPPVPHMVLPEGYAAVPEVRGYEYLMEALMRAYLQAATGKGKDRHTTTAVGFQPWHLQPTMNSARQIGPGGPAFQAMKKAQEAVTLAGNKDFERAMAEALGIIHYGAVLYWLLDEMGGVANGGGG